MAIEINGTVAKPHIWLIGNIEQDGVSSTFSERVDNAKHLMPNATQIVGGGVTDLDKENLLTFRDSVRVIITGQVGTKPVYVREGRDAPLFNQASSLEFEGEAVPNTDAVSYYAETWYTFNGKDPVRSAARFYNFTDMDDASFDPSSGLINNTSTLGFVLRTNPASGSDLITLKAKTYYQGKESKIAIVVFKVVEPQGNLEFFQNPE